MNVTGYRDTSIVYQFTDIINNNCYNWRNYSTLSHVSYMYGFFFYLLLGMVRNFYNPHIKYNFIIFGINCYIDEYLIDYLQWCILGFIFLRIFQVYWISVLYLGGL